MNYANEPSQAALERSSHTARLIEFLKRILIYLFII